MFSRRTAWDHTPNPLTRVQRELRAAGHSLLDLTRSNPTACGFEYADEEILGALAGRESLRYTRIPGGSGSPARRLPPTTAGTGSRSTPTTCC